MKKHDTSLINKIFRDKNGHIVIWQLPNAPLIVWIVCAVLQRVFSHGKPHTGFHLLGQAALFTWAYLELTSGASLFRRIAGAFVLAATTASFFM